VGRRAEHLGPAKRRPLVLDAALDIFAEGGFADASMAAVARRAGITKPVLYDCFPGGKQEIYFALLDREEERFLDHMVGVVSATRHMPLEGALRAGLSAFLEYAEINPSAFRVIFGAPGTSDPEIARRFERAGERIVGLIGERASEIAASAGAAPVFGELYARAIVALGDYVARWWVKEKPMEHDVMVSALVAWMMRGFEGIVPRDALREGR
jgi:AcrR family transcriptional regulator